MTVLRSPRYEIAMPRTSHATKRARARNLLAGLAKRVSPRDEVLIEGQVFSRRQLTALFQEHLDAIEAIHAARAALSVAVAEERVIAARVWAVSQGFQAYVSSVIGKTADIFNDFGFEVPKKPGPKTVAGKLAGSRKSAATRAARKTVGSRQRLKIKGMLETE
jgi:hypothetical protein